MIEHSFKLLHKKIFMWFVELRSGIIAIVILPFAYLNILALNKDFLSFLFSINIFVPFSSEYLYLLSLTSLKVFENSENK